MTLHATYVGTEGADLVRGANLRLLLEREAEIVALPRYFFAPAGDFGGPFFGGCRLGIGHLLELWKRPGWIQACPECGGRAHLTTIVLLLNSSFWRGGCLDCGRRVEGGDGELGGWRRRGDFCFRMAAAAREATNRRGPEAKVVPGERPRFSWSQGLIGRWTPDLVVEPAVDPAPLAVLLEILRSGKGEVVLREPDGAPRFHFDWAAETLCDADGRLLFRRDGERLLDGDGRLAFLWDSLYLCGPQRAYLYESHPSEGLQPRLLADPDLSQREARATDRALSFDRFRGLNVMHTDGTSIWRSDHTRVLGTDQRIPPVFAFLAWRALEPGAMP